MEDYRLKDIDEKGLEFINKTFDEMGVDSIYDEKFMLYWSQNIEEGSWLASFFVNPFLSDTVKGRNKLSYIFDNGVSIQEKGPAGNIIFVEFMASRGEQHAFYALRQYLHEEPVIPETIIYNLMYCYGYSPFVSRLLD